MTIKNILKAFYILLSILLVIVLGLMIWAYAPDNSVEELTEKWGYDNSKFVEIDGMNIHYRVNGEGFPVVLVHGTAASLHTWEAWTTALEDSFQVISFDLPAYGLTGPHPTGRYSMDMYAKILDELMLELAIDSFYLAGNSLGGGIAWRYSTLYPDKVKKMILIDAAGFPLEREPSLPFRLAKSEIWSRLLTTFTPKRIIENSIKEVYFDKEKATPNIIDRYYDFALRTGNRQAFVDRVRTMEYADTALLAGIKIPTLIQWGRGDVWIPVSNAYKFEKVIPNSKLVIYENAGHIPMEEIPNETVKDAKAFFLE
jgi:pimeloyl-ACP methyl ester carboxylesterase